VINDGVFIADRAALLGVDTVLRNCPGLTAWVHGRADVWWRQKAALNIALARLDAAVPMAARHNVQLHVTKVEAASTPGQALASYAGEPVTVLHFNGAGRVQHPQWRSRVLEPTPALPRDRP
jgi:hypothetical protein